MNHMKLQLNTKRFTAIHTTVQSCCVSLRLENSTTLIDISAVYTQAQASWCNCSYHIFALFFSGYKGHSDTGIKQASKEASERDQFNKK